MPDAAARSAAAFGAATAHPRALEAGVEDAKQQSRVAVTRNRAEYEQALAEDEDLILAGEAANPHLSGCARQPDVSVDSLRRWARALRVENGGLLAYFRLTQAKVSAGRAFVESVVYSSQALFLNASELVVLEE